jgi:hypothetical protein
MGPELEVGAYARSTTAPFAFPAEIVVVFGGSEMPQFNRRLHIGISGQIGFLLEHTEDSHRLAKQG